MSVLEVAPRGLSGSKGGSPKQTPDNLFSTDLVEALIGVSEGPIKGLKDGAKSYLVGDTPLEGIDGSPNFDNFELIVGEGSLLGENIQSRLGGFGSSTNVNTELSSTVSVVRQGLHANIDYLDVRLLVNRLMKSTKKGTFKHKGVVKIEYRKTGTTPWIPAHTLGDNPVPVYEAASGLTIYRSAEAERGKSGKVAASPGDRVTYVASAAPFTSQDKALWFQTSGNHRPYYRDDDSWVQMPGATVATVGAFKVWTWSEESSWGTDKATKAFVGPNPAPKDREQGDFWINTISGAVYFFNGSSWIVAGSSLDPAELAGVDPDNDDENDIDVQNGEVSIEGKTTSSYVVELRIPVENYNGLYDLRVTKVTENNTTEQFFDVTWESFQELTAKAYKFPGLATAHLMGRASDQFSSMPNFSGIFQGRIVKVPSNYDPVARTYSGSWDGIWKLEFTDNPAFVANDLIENDRYGMNAYYPVVLNKWDVYDAGQWCDARTADGRPRFTFNRLLQDPMGGPEAIDYICGIFGGRFFDDGNGKAVIRIDRDGNPVQMFMPENVVDGLFVYSFTEIQTRFNDITVSFINPDLNYQEDRRRLSDPSFILKHGRIPHNFIAVGCNSAEEAIVRARYKLVTAITENRLVNFKTNRKGLYLSPYDVILIADDEMASGLSGRVKAIMGANSFSLRDPIYLEPGSNYRVRFELVNAAGTYETVTRDIPGGTTGTLTSITTTAALPTLPALATFAIETTDSKAVPQAYRVTNIAEVEGDPDNVEISAVLMNRLKWGYVDGVLPLEATIDRYEVRSRERPKPVENLRIQPNKTDVGLSIGTDLILDWDAPDSVGIQKYTVAVSRNNGPFAVVAETYGPKFEWNDVLDGEYQIQVRTWNVFGNSSEPVTISHRLLGDVRDEADVLTIRMVDEPFANIFESRSPKFAWNPSVLKSHRQYKVQVIDPSSVMVYETMTTDTNFTWEFDLNAAANSGTAKRSFTVRVSSLDKAGRESTPSTIAVSNPPPAVPLAVAKSVNWKTVTLQAERPEARDIIGMMVWTGTQQNFVPAEGNRVYRGPNTNVSLDVTPGTTRYYRMAFYDAFGTTGLNYSDEISLVIPTIPVLDLTAPLTPTGLALTSQLRMDGSVVLIATWNPNAENDLAAYDLQIKEGTGNFISQPTNSNRWERPALPATLYTARLLAKDIAQNPSPFTAEVSHITTKDNVPPAVPASFNVYPGVGSMWLTWDANQEIDLQNYEVYEAAAATPVPVLATAAAFVVGSNTLARTGLPGSATRYYWVRAVDTSGNKSAWSVVKNGTTAPDFAITPAQLDAAINQTAYAQSIEAPRVVSSLPTPVASYTASKKVYLTTDKKIYVKNAAGTAWVPEFAAEVIEGILKDVQVEALAASKVTGQLTNAQLAAIDAAKVAGQLTNAQLADIAATKITGQLTATQLAAIEATKITGQLTDTQLAAISAIKITGQLNTAQLADGIISATKLATGLRPIEVVSSLPATGNTQGRIVFLTTDNNLYRWTGTAWVRSVAAADISGQLTAAQLSAIEAAKISGQLTSAQIASIASTQVTGQLSNAQLADIAATKITGQLTNAQLADIAATKITGQLTDIQLADISAAKISGQLSSSQLVDGIISTAKLAPGLRPIEVVSSLPATGNTQGRIVFLTTDNNLYRWTGTAWVRSIAASDVTGQLSNAQLAAIDATKISGQLTNTQLADIAATKITGQLSNAQLADIAATKITGQLTNTQLADIAATKITGQLTNTQLADIAATKITGQLVASQLGNGIIDTSKLATGLRPIEVVSTLPASGNIQGRIVFLTTDNNLYRWDGSTWIRSVAASDVTGQLSNAQLASIDAVKIAGLLTNSQLADIAATKITGQLTSSQIASLSATKIAGQLTDAQLASIDATKVAGQLSNSQLADIAASKLTGQLVATQLADGIISATKMASGLRPIEIVSSLPASGNTQGRVVVLTTDNNLYRWTGTAWVRSVAAGDVTGQLTASQIASIASTQISGQLTASQLAAIEAAKVTGQLTSAQLADSAITTVKIAPDAITAPKIAANAVTAEHIVAGTITSAEIAAGAIVAGKIAANAVTTTALAANSVSATHIVAGTITAAEIASGAITTAKLAAGAVTASTIAANAITAAAIAAGAVTATEIAAGAIIASKLAIGDTGNSYPDPDMLDDSLYAQVAGTYIREANGFATPSKNRLVIPYPGTNTVAYTMGPVIPVEGGNPYWIGGYIGGQSQAQAQLSIRWCSDREGNVDIFGTSVYTSAQGDNNAREVLNGLQLVAPADARSMRVQFSRVANGQTIGVAYFSGITIRRATSGELIVDGAITADKIAANAITATHIVAGTITATEIASNAITAAKLSAGSVVAGKIAANAVTANEIAANAVTATKVAADSISASHIVAGTITTTEIAAGAITTTQLAAGSIITGKIAAGAVTANEVAANAVTATKIAANSISATHIVAGTITAAEIASNAITTAKIAAGAVTANEIATNAITATKIAAGAITAVAIAAGTITADRLVLGDTSNMVPDSDMRAASQWSAPAGWTLYEGPSPNGFKSSGFAGWDKATAQTANGSPLVSSVFPVNDGESYAFFIQTWTNSGNYQIYCRVNWLNATGAIITPSSDFVAAQTFGPGGVITHSGSYIAPAGAKTARLLLYVHKDNSTATFIQTGGWRAHRRATAEMIVDGAITADKIAANAVTATKIAANSISATHIVAGTITAAEIASNAITTAKIAAGAITTAAIAAGAVTANEIAAGAITTTQLAAGSIITGKIAAGAVTANEVAANAVTATKIAANSISATHIVAGTITAAEIASNAITTAKIAAGAITTAAIAAGAVTANEIAANAVTATAIAAGSIITGKIAAGAVTANEIAANAVTATKIAANSISATHIVAGTITAAEIASNAITTAKIAAGAITTNEIAANAIVAGKIAAGAITAAAIAAGTITADRLVLGDTSNMVPDPDMRSASQWSVPTGWSFVAGPTATGFKSSGFVSWDRATALTGNGSPLQSGAFSVNDGESYAFFIQTWTNSGTYQIHCRVTWLDAAGAIISNSDFVGGQAFTAGNTITHTGSYPAPSAAKTARLQLYVNKDASSATFVQTGGWRTNRRATAELIVDGAIIAGKIAANAVTAATIEAGAITTAKIAAGAVTAGEIAANAVTATAIAAGSIITGKIAAGAVTANEIAANAVTATKIAANSVSAFHIVAGTITANEIAANAITTAKITAGAVTTAAIAAGAITANEIAANAITAVKISAGAITTAAIATGAVTANEIAANAITAVKIAANAVTATAIAAGAITANAIAANAITTGAIAAGAVTATEIAAGAITATKLAVTSENIWPDGNFLDAGMGYFASGGSYVITTNNFTGQGSPGTKVLVVPYPGSNVDVSAYHVTFLQVSGGKPYWIGGYQGGQSLAQARLIAQWWSGTQASPTYVSEDTVYTSASGDTNAREQLNGAIFTPPANARLLRLVWRRISNGQIGEVYFHWPVVRRASSGELIVDGAISADKIAANAVTATKIAADSISAVHIIAGAITTAELASNSVTTAKIAAGAVVTASLSAGAVTANEIAANAVTATQLTAGSVTTAKIAAGAVTANEIAANAITAVKISANSISAAHIVSGTITASQLAANSVTATQIAAGAVVAGKLSAGAVVAGNVAANAITTGTIAANAVTAGTIAANAITTGTIAAAAVGADQIAANSISAQHLLVSDTQNLVPDNSMMSEAAWSVPADWNFSSGPINTGFRSAGQASWVYVSGQTGYSNPLETRKFTVNGGTEYFFSFQTYSTQNHKVWARVVFFNYLGNEITIGADSYVTVGSTDNLPAGINGLAAAIVTPANAKTAVMRLSVNRGAVTSTVATGGFLAIRKANGELIVDGSIRSNHLVTDSAVITGTAQIGDAVITSAKIITLDAAKLVAGSTISGSVLVAGGTSISTLTSNAATGAQDPAVRINSASTAIDPGKIRINGAGTVRLSNWIKGGDDTRIDGGMISADTIRANQLEIGSRNVTLDGIVFNSNDPAANRASWSSGNITWVNDAGVTVTNGIAGGSTGVWTSGVIFIYWAKGANALSFTTSSATAFLPTNLVVATYRGGVDLDPDYGRVLIDGSTIKAYTISAQQISVTNLSAISASLGTVDISSANIGTLTVGTSNIGTKAVTDLQFGSTSANTLEDGNTETISNVTVNVAGDNKVVLFACLSAATGPTGLGTPTLKMIISRGATVLYDGGDMSLGGWLSFSALAADLSPAAGNNTYSLKIVNSAYTTSNTRNVTTRQGRLIAVSCKR